MHGLTSIRPLLNTIVGGLLVLSGLFFNEQTISFLSSDHRITTPGFRLLIFLIEAYLILAGLIFIIRRGKLEVGKLLLFLASNAGMLVLLVLLDLAASYLKARQPFPEINEFKYHANSRSALTHTVKGLEKTNLFQRRHVGEGRFDVVYTYDKDGFRVTGPERSSRPDCGVYFFGDSFTHGYGVDDDSTFPSLIARDYLTDRVAVYNAATNGQGVINMAERFLAVQHRLKPGDKVIFTPTSADLRRNIHDFYYWYSMLYRNKLLSITVPVFQDGGIIHAELRRSRTADLKYLFLNAPGTGYLWRYLYQSIIPDTTVESGEMLNMVKTLVEQKDCDFILFFLPVEGECAGGVYYEDLNQFDYLDIMSYFPTERNKLRDICLKDDSHWNRKGHEIAAKAIVETLIDHGIIDPSYLKNPRK